MIASVVDSRTRFKAKVWRLVPKDWNTSAYLNERHFLAVVFDNLLGFHEIRNVALAVDAATEKSRTGTFR